MDWLSKILALFKRPGADHNAAEWKAISEARSATLEEIKYLKDEHKSRADDYQRQLRELREKDFMDLNDDEKLDAKNREEEYLKQLLIDNDTKRDLNEKVIFLKILLKGMGYNLENLENDNH